MNDALDKNVSDRYRLADAWLRLLDQLEVERGPARAAFGRLAELYGEEGRAYHNLEHVGRVLAWVSRLAPYALHPAEVRLAAWFHDAIYRPEATDNEEQSAALAEEMLAGMGLAPGRVARVGRLVRLTTGHRAAPDDGDGHVLLDADLAVLGAPPAVYAAYAQAIRREYAHLSDAVFEQGRRQVLRRLLDRPHLYQTPLLRARREAAARANLQWEVETGLDLDIESFPITPKGSNL